MLVYRKMVLIIEANSACADPEGGRGPDPPPPTLKSHKNIGFFSNIGQDPLKNHKAVKPAFNVDPSTKRHRNAI